MQHLRKYCKITCLFCCIAALLSSCSGNDDATKVIEMPLHIRIPVEGQPSRATIGDPGTDDAWDFPTQLYLFLVTYTSTADATNETNPTFTYASVPLTEEWTYDASASDPANGINIYTYDGSASVAIENDVAVARAYVAVCNGSLVLSKTSGFASEEELRNLEFSIPAEINATSSPTRCQLLKNLYSTAADLEYSGLTGDYASYNGQYYGTILNINSITPSIDLICYHVAAKLDLQWNVNASIRENVKISQIVANDLYNTGKLFRPANSASGTQTLYTEDVMSTATEDAGKGMMWNGRASIYMLYPNQARTLSLTFANGWGASKTTYNRSISLTKYSETDAIYSPWIRGTLTINSLLD